MLVAPASNSSRPSTPADPVQQAPTQNDAVAKLQKCKILEKLKKGETHNITRDNVKELFEALDGNESGELSHSDLSVLKSIADLKLTDTDIADLIKDCDKDRTGAISVEELYEALTCGSIVYKNVLNQLEKGAKATKTTECSREDLRMFLHEEYDTNSALWSLPSTLLIFFLFMIIVILHLDVATVFQAHNAILGEVTGEGSPYLYKYVHDVPTFWYWAKTSFVSSHFKNDLDVWPYPGRLASYNQIIGGIQLVKGFTSPESCAQSSLLQEAYDTLMRHEGDARCHKIGDSDSESEFFFYHIRDANITERINELEAMNWIDQNTTVLDFTILFYNAHLNTFTSYHLTLDFKFDGEVKILFDMETFLADPYYNKLVLIPDLLFALFLFKVFWSEIKELVPAALNGWDGFLDYLEFWNVVDWLSIFMGVVVITLWGIVCSKVSFDLQDRISELPSKQLDQIIVSNQTFLTPYEVEQIVPVAVFEKKLGRVHEAMNEVATLHYALRVSIFFYSIILMLKFFKAFRANPRLNIVIMTITESAVDMVHFLIVFLTIFFVFSLMAYVSFGNMIKEFSDIYRSVMMCWRVLMGEFDVGGMEAVDLPLAWMWMIAFQWIVLLVLLNMLLAIIMDTYSGVKGMKENPITIWAQTKQAVNRIRETRGHLDLWYLICELEDDDYPAHPGKQVTTKTLRRAFERDKMTRRNAEYLVRRAGEWCIEQAGVCDLQMTDAIRLIAQVRSQVMKTSTQSDHIVDMLKAQERAPQDARFDAILGGYDPDTLQPVGGSTALALSTQFGQPQRPIAAGTPVNQHTLTGLGTNQFPGSVLSTQSIGMHAAGVTNTLDLPNTPEPLLPMTNAPVRPDAKQSIAGLNVTSTSFISDVSNVSGPPGTAGAGAAQTLRKLGQVEARMAQMQASLDSMQEALADQRSHAKDKDAWLEKRMNDLGRRCEKAEMVSDRLYSLLINLDVQELAAMPKMVSDLTKKTSNLANITERINELEAANVVLQAPEVVCEGDSAPETEIAKRPRPPGGEDRSAQHLAQRLNRLDDQVAKLLSHAEEASDMKQLLWRVDLNLRQLRGTGNIPAQQAGATAPSNIRHATEGSFVVGSGGNQLPIGASSGSPSKPPSRMPSVRSASAEASGSTGFRRSIPGVPFGDS